MGNKHYGLTRGHNPDVRDAVPDWMNDILKNLQDIRRSKAERVHPFAGIDDPILNPQRIGIVDPKRDKI